MKKFKVSAAGRRRARRLLVQASVVAVGLIAAKLSYGHIEEVALLGGEVAANARLVPLLVDIPAILAGILATEDRLAGRRPRPWAKWTVIVCVAASLAANGTTNFLHSPTNIIGYFVAVWPAVALALVTALVLHSEEVPTRAPQGRRQGRRPAGRKPAASKAKGESPAATLTLTKSA